MAILKIVYLVISIIIFFFLVFPFLKVMLSLLTRDKVDRSVVDKSDFKKYDFGNIITAYKNADIAKPLIQSLLKQTHENHIIYLVADNCNIDGWDVFDDRLVVLNPQPPMNLKVKSIIHAVENFKRDHEYIAIYDADNLAHPNFLEEINIYANNGFTSIQGQRTAKNLDSMYACTDALGEFYKNYVERYVPYLIGSSAVISGSGMAVESELYKSYLYGKEITAGKELWKKMLQEDKILQNHLLFRNEKISYAWDAIVYDEKVDSGEQVETQRSRWLYSYFQNLPNSSGLVAKGLFTFSWNRLLFGLVTIAPPMFIMIFLAGILFLAGIYFSPLMSGMLFLGGCIFVGNIFLSLYLSKVPKPIWKAVANTPNFIFNQITGLFKMGNPNKNFKASEHKHSVSIDEILNKD